MTHAENKIILPRFCGGGEFDGGVKFCTSANNIINTNNFIHNFSISPPADDNIEEEVKQILLKYK